tara:strand:+ start:103 stop:669 length:567 start_codon:yes stop_codon:yes gene_type:complete
MSGFEYELTEKQKFFLYLYQLLPNIELIRSIWKRYKLDLDKNILDYYNKISPFRDHPCGSDSILPKICGIDNDMFVIYISNRLPLLQTIKIVGHPLLICQLDVYKDELEKCRDYFDRILNSHQIKLSKLTRVRILNKIIRILENDTSMVDFQCLINYIYTIYKMYSDMKILKAYPIAIDKDGKLLRFE